MTEPGLFSRCRKIRILDRFELFISLWLRKIADILAAACRTGRSQGRKFSVPVQPEIEGTVQA